MYFMKYYYIFLTLLNLVCSQTSEQHYSRVKIFTGKEGIQQLSKSGIAVDHVEFKKDVYIITDLSSEEIKKVKKTGLKYEILIKDVVKHYQDQNKKK